jgi:hypothetical protein
MALNSSDCTVSGDKKINEKFLRKDVEESGRGLI